MFLYCAAAMALVGMGAVALAGFAWNALIGSRNEVDNSFNQIDVQLKRRHDLVPQLLNVVKGVMKHEKETLALVTKARYEALRSSSPESRIQSEMALTGAMSNFMAIAENYPELKSFEPFKVLQEQLVTTENRISFSRQRYNDCVMAYDNTRQGFPGILLASNSRFPSKMYWQIDNVAQRDVPKMEF